MGYEPPREVLVVTFGQYGCLYGACNSRNRNEWVCTPLNCIVSSCKCASTPWKLSAQNEPLLLVWWIAPLWTSNWNMTKACSGKRRCKTNFTVISGIDYRAQVLYWSFSYSSWWLNGIPTIFCFLCAHEWTDWKYISNWVQTMKAVETW